MVNSSLISSYAQVMDDWLSPCWDTRKRVEMLSRSSEVGGRGSEVGLLKLGVERWMFHRPRSKRRTSNPERPRHPNPDLRPPLRFPPCTITDFVPPPCWGCFRDCC